jgi:hypothetical protein
MKNKTLQEQYNLIQEGKGNKEVFLREAKRQFPNLIRNAAPLNEATQKLKSRGIISENTIMNNSGKESWEIKYKQFLKLLTITQLCVDDWCADCRTFHHGLP